MQVTNILGEINGLKNKFRHRCVICQYRFPIFRINYTKRKFASMQACIYEVSERVKMSFNIGNQGATQLHYVLV